MPKSFLVKKSKFGLEEDRHERNARIRQTDNETNISSKASYPVDTNSSLLVQLNNGYMHSMVPEGLPTTTEELIPEGQSMTSPESTKTADFFVYKQHLPHDHDTENYGAFIVLDGRMKRNQHDVTPKQRFPCEECGKDYATSSNLSRHKQTHRSLDSQMAKKCPHCEKVYVSMPALSMHILTHNLKHVCQFCGKSFSRPWLLRGHIRSHSGHKPFGCSHCGKAFADRSNLRAHMNTHSAFKQFKCQYCKKTFALKSYLNKHYESMCLK